MVNPAKICPQCGAEYPANARFCEIDGTSLRSTASDSDMVGTIVAERYHILRKLGEGGMGQVYLAEHVKMGRKSALKVLHASMVKDVDAISRFNREAANASRISHPNVAAVYDFGETQDGLIFLAMEFVDGPPLTKVIQESGALAPRRAAEIIRQAADALAQAHDMGIVHRDLKPDNIMIARTREGGDLVKVVDFGIAKAAGNEAQKVTKTGLVVGTPEYMSPEQLAGDTLDGRSDIYSLALVAFNMLTGRLPFPSDSAQESMIMRLTDRPKALAEMRPEVAWPADVQAVFDKALERDVSRRYQTATEFGRDVYNSIARMPDAAAPGVGAQGLQLPPTRVSPPDQEPMPLPAPSMQPPPTRAPMVAADPRPEPVAVTHTAAPPRRKGIFIVAGIAAVIVVAAVVVPMAMRGATTKSIQNPTAVPGGNGTAGPTDTTITKKKQGGGTTSGTAQQGDSSGPVKSDGADPGEPKRRGNSSLGPIGLELTGAETDVTKDDPRIARGLLNRMDKLEPKVPTANDSIRVALVRFKAYLTLQNTKEACAALERVKTLAPGTRLEKRVNDQLEGCQ